MNPLLAGKISLDDLPRLRYPLWLAVKLDGIRARVTQDGLMSRRNILIPNRHVQHVAQAWPLGLEGELMVDGPRRAVSSAIMSRDGEPDFTFNAFDIARPSMEFKSYKDRLRIMYDLTVPLWDEGVRVIGLAMVQTAEETHAMAMDWIGKGAEGVVLRDPTGIYKRGRSSLREQLMLKLKLADDTEATVIALNEEMENLNAEDERGRRHGFKEGKFGKGRLGSVDCRFDDGAEFNCGSGFDADERELFWQQPELLLGKRITVQHEMGRADGQRPSFPVFKGLREDL